MEGTQEVAIAKPGAATDAPPARTLLSVQQFSDKHRAWTVAALRNVIFNAEPRTTARAKIAGNGLSVALVRIGRRLLIDEARFLAWEQDAAKARERARHDEALAEASGDLLGIAHQAGHRDAAKRILAILAGVLPAKETERLAREHSIDAPGGPCRTA